MFRILKRVFGFEKVRYRGVAKNRVTRPFSGLRTLRSERGLAFAMEEEDSQRLKTFLAYDVRSLSGPLRERSCVLRKLLRWSGLDRAVRRKALAFATDAACHGFSVVSS